MIQFIYDSDKELFQNAMTFAQKQVRRLIENYPDSSKAVPEIGPLMLVRFAE